MARPNRPSKAGMSDRLSAVDHAGAGAEIQVEVIDPALARRANTPIVIYVIYLSRGEDVQAVFTGARLRDALHDTATKSRYTLDRQPKYKLSQSRHLLGPADGPTS